jgi:hypothetical protein
VRDPIQKTINKYRRLSPNRADVFSASYLNLLRKPASNDKKCLVKSWCEITTSRKILLPYVADVANALASSSFDIRDVRKSNM